MLNPKDYLILSIISRKISINVINDHGITYAQFSDLLSKLIEQKLVLVNENSEPSISENAKKLMAEHNFMKNEQKADMIKIETSFLGKKIDIDDIFLPENIKVLKRDG